MKTTFIFQTNAEIVGGANFDNGTEIIPNVGDEVTFESSCLFQNGEITCMNATAKVTQRRLDYRFVEAKTQQLFVHMTVNNVRTEPR